MRPLTASASATARRSSHVAPGPWVPDVERGPRTSGVQGLLRIAELSSKGTDRHGFVSAVLDSASRSLHAEAAVLLVPAVDGEQLRHAGAPPVVRRLLTHVRALAPPRRQEALTWTGEERGLAVLGALIPDTGPARVVLCVGRDSQGAGFLRRERELLLSYAQTTALVLERMRLQERLERQQTDVMAAFVSALASRDGYLQGHSTRVAVYTEAVARAMGLPADDVRMARRTGILHDLGKLSTPDCILLKPAALTDDEYGHIKHHPTVAAALLEPYGFLATEAAAVKRHHERYDGTGYPDGLSGAEIPLAARLVSVADAFDAMTSDRPYRSALAFDVARDEIRQGAGRQFDPAVADAWLSIPDAQLGEIGRSAAAGPGTIHQLLVSEPRAAAPAWSA